MALASCAREAAWLRRLLQELNAIRSTNEDPTEVFCDNMSTIKLADNPIFHARTKHIEIAHHYIRERVATGEIALSHVSSQDNVADIFTKPLSRILFEKLRSELGLVSTKLSVSQPDN